MTKVYNAGVALGAVLLNFYYFVLGLPWHATIEVEEEEEFFNGDE